MVATCLGFALGPAAANRALADTVRMKNGDVVTGEVIEFRSDELLIDPDFTDEIKIELEHIESIETTRRMTIRYDDGTEVRGYLFLDADGNVRVRDTAPTEIKRPADGKEDAKGPAVLPDGAEGLLVDWNNLYRMEQTKTYFHYEANIDLGINAASGNSDSSSVVLSGLLAPSFGNNAFTFKGQLNRATSEGDTTASNWRIDGLYEREVRPRLAIAAINSYEQDRLQDLDLRLTFGIGTTYKIFEPDPTLLKVGLFPAFVDEDFSTNDDDTQFAALLWTLNFAQDVFSDDFSFYHDHKVTTGVTESGVIVLTTTGLKFELIADFSLLLELQYDWRSDPAEDASGTDRRYNVKLSYDFEGDETDWWR